MATVNRGTIYVARQSFSVWDGGRLLAFRRGRTTIRAGHRLLEGREDRFAPLVVTHEVDPPGKAETPAKVSAAHRTAKPEPVAEPAASVDEATHESAGSDDDITA